jgi:tRNA1Val (adenine37-N6)-methyltransferase
MKDEFAFQHFSIRQDHCAMKVGTDGVLLGSWTAMLFSDARLLPFYRILDIGTGTGLIALMMAQSFPSSNVDALEIDQDACSQAADNVNHSPFSSRIKIIGESLQSFSLSKTSFSYDLIVSNPPFFIYDHSLKSSDIKRDKARHTSTLSYKELFTGVKRLLAPHGLFCTIIPFEVSENFIAEGYFAGLVMNRRCMVKTMEGKTPKRCLLAFSGQRTSLPENVTEVMMTRDGHPTEWWSRLTRDFYIDPSMKR